MKLTVRKAAALLLVLCVLLALAACGDGDDSTKGPDGGTAQNPEYVYTASYKNLRKNSEDFSMPKAVTDEGFYTTGSEKIGENIPEGVKPEYEGQYDVYAPYISFFNFDGQETRLANYIPQELDIDSAGRKDFSSWQSVDYLLVNDDGTLAVVESCYLSWIDSPEGVTVDDGSYYDYYRYESLNFFRVLDSTGAELSSAKLDLGGEDVFIYDLTLDENGNLVINTDERLMAFDPDGTKLYEISINGYIRSLVRLADGRTAVRMYENGNGYALRIIDAAAGDFAAQSYTMSYDANDLIAGAGEYDLYYTGGVNFYGYSLAEQSAEKLFSWLDCDVNGSELELVSVNKNGVISGFTCRYSDNYETCDLNHITVEKAPYNPAAQKKTLRLATMYIDDRTIETVLDFNRSGGEYRIEVTDYSEFNTEDDYTAGKTKLNTEIMSGDMPDILALDELAYRQLASRGLLENLYPYLDADSELSRDDFFPNVLSALEVDGGLYCAPGGFSVVSAVGASSVVGDEPGWTYDDYYAALAQMPEGCEGFGMAYDRSTMLSICLMLDLNDYMDWATGECRFDSEEFIKLLEFANSCGEFNYENYEYSAEDSDTSRIQQGQQMLKMVGFSDLDFMYENYSQLFGGEVTFVGFPTMHGVGNVMAINDSYCISSSCEYKDAAWQFVHTILGDEHQRSGYYLPININVFEEKLANAMKVEYVKDIDGNYILDENGERIPESKGTVFDGTGTYEIYAVTPEQAEQLREVIANTTKLADYDESIGKIVTEQAQAYFSGQKTAQEVARLIQSKASIYINEQR